MEYYIYLLNFPTKNFTKANKKSLKWSSACPCPCEEGKGLKWTYWIEGTMSVPLTWISIEHFSGSSQVMSRPRNSLSHAFHKLTLFRRILHWVYLTQQNRLFNSLHSETFLSQLFKSLCFVCSALFLISFSATWLGLHWYSFTVILHLRQTYKQRVCNQAVM